MRYREKLASLVEHSAAQYYIDDAEQRAEQESYHHNNGKSNRNDSFHTGFAIGFTDRLTHNYRITILHNTQSIIIIEKPGRDKSPPLQI